MPLWGNAYINELKWLTGYRFDRLESYEFNWDIVFAPQATLSVDCLWRLLEEGHIVLTSEDDGHQFDVAKEVNRRLAGAKITSIVYRADTLDLTFAFDNGITLEILPISSGYEAWQLNGRGALSVATGGGRLDVIYDENETRLPRRDLS